MRYTYLHTPCSFSEIHPQTSCHHSLVTDFPNLFFLSPRPSHQPFRMNQGRLVPLAISPKRAMRVLISVRPAFFQRHCRAGYSKQQSISGAHTVQIQLKQGWSLFPSQSVSPKQICTRADQMRANAKGVWEVCSCNYLCHFYLEMCICDVITQCIG